MYIIGSSIVVDRLIPGTGYSFTVRAYQDILGPASTTVHTTTDDGKSKNVNINILPPL